MCDFKCCMENSNMFKSCRGPALKATLLKQFSFRKISLSEMMFQHLNIFFEIADKLREMKVEIADDLLSFLLLYGVPETFKIFWCAIEWRYELLKPESLKIKILEEWELRKGKTAQDSQNTFFIENKRSCQEQKEMKNEEKKSNWKKLKKGNKGSMILTIYK